MAISATFAFGSYDIPMNNSNMQSSRAISALQRANSSYAVA